MANIDIEQQYSDIKIINIHTEKELTTEFESLFSILVDTNGDWNKRLNAIKRVEGIILGGGYNLANFSNLISKYYLHLNAQLNDLRSVISKEACRLLCLTGKICKDKIDTLCEKLMNKECLLKVINSGNKLIAENGHEVILYLVEYAKNPKIIPKIIEEFVSKNQGVRYRIAQYFYKILELYDITILEKNIGLIETALYSNITDANQDTRKIMRQAYKLYCMRFPAKAEKLLNRFDLFVQKALIDDGIINHDLTICQNIGLNKTYNIAYTDSTINDSTANTKSTSMTNISSVSLNKTPTKSKLKQEINQSYDDTLDIKCSSPSSPMSNKNASNGNGSGNGVNTKPYNNKQKLSNTLTVTTFGNTNGANTPLKNNWVVNKPANETNEIKGSINNDRAKSKNKIKGSGDGYNDLYIEKPIKNNEMEIEDNNSLSPAMTTSSLGLLKRPDISLLKKNPHDMVVVSVSVDNTPTTMVSSSNSTDKAKVSMDNTPTTATSSTSMDKPKGSKKRVSIAKSKEKTINAVQEQKEDYNEYGVTFSQCIKEEELRFLIGKTNDDNWAIRYNSFEKINEFITGLKPTEIINNQLIESLISSHVQHLNDVHVKVILACMNSLIKLIVLLPDQLFSQMEKIVPQVIINLTENKDKLYNSANYLITLIVKVYQGDDLMPILLKAFDINQKTRYRISILEIINTIMRQTKKFFESTNNVRACITKLGHFIYENHGNKLAIMPCLSIIYYLREKNLQQTLFYILSLPNSQLQSIRNIALQYAPELEEDFKQYCNRESLGKPTQKGESAQGILGNTQQMGSQPIIQQNGQSLSIQQVIKLPIQQQQPFQQQSIKSKENVREKSPDQQMKQRQCINPEQLKAKKAINDVDNTAMTMTSASRRKSESIYHHPLIEFKKADSDNRRTLSPKKPDINANANANNGIERKNNVRQRENLTDICDEESKVIKQNRVENGSNSNRMDNGKGQKKNLNNSFSCYSSQGGTRSPAKFMLGSNNNNIATSLLNPSSNNENQGGCSDPDDEAIHEYQVSSKAPSTMEGASAEELEDGEEELKDSIEDVDERKGKKGTKITSMEGKGKSNAAMAALVATKNMIGGQKQGELDQMADKHNRVESVSTKPELQRIQESHMEEEIVYKDIGLDEIAKRIKEYPKSTGILENSLESIINELYRKASNPRDGQYIPDLLTKLMSLPLPHGSNIKKILRAILTLCHNPQIACEHIEALLSKVVDLGYPVHCIETIIENLEDQEIPITQLLIRYLGLLYTKGPHLIAKTTLPNLIEKFKKLLTHPSAEIRKNVVFCLVDLTFIFTNFTQEYMKEFPAAQQKLVTIYVQRRVEQNASANI